VLRRLHLGRNRRPVAESIGRLLEAVRAHAGIAIWPTGEQALANCLRSIDLARRFERRGASSFRAFVEHLEAEAERGQSEDAPVVEEGTEGVRLMTVHRAKGLEFPVVILADPTANATPAKPSRHVVTDRRLWLEPLCGSVPPELLEAAPEELRRDTDEAVRLTYVAATRARDLLVAPGIGDADAADDVVDGWLAALNPALYPAHEARRAPESANAPGCPSFGDDSVYERPERVFRGPGASVRPGLHRPQAGEHSVVWWDPSALELDRQEEVGLRQQRILEADEGGTVAVAGEEAHRRWQAGRAEATQRASAPSVRVEAVTTLSRTGAAERAARDREGEAGAAALPPIEVETVDVDRSERPGGARFGALVHAILATVELAASEGEIAAAARAHGRLVGAVDPEVEAAAETANAALAHPLMRRAARCASSGALRREVPVLVRLEDGALAEGVVDLAFRETDAPTWTVVDFKTDRELAGGRARYEAQLRLYAAAVSRATGEPVRGVLLAV
jgi:ATP-dependent exoDNAse (exonuclease V) beta subunit